MAKKEAMSHGVNEEREFDWQRAFFQLTGYLARKRKEELARVHPDERWNVAAERAWALECAYAYASGIAEASGTKLPDLKG